MSTISPIKILKQALKKFTLLVRIKRWLWRILFNEARGFSCLNVVDSFPLFVPYSAGSYKDRSRLTIQTINQIFPFLSSFISSVAQRSLQITPITEFPKSNEELASVAALGKMFNAYGSDKAKNHNYHYVYGVILKDAFNIRSMLEIGMGTNNTDVVSNMTSEGKPGASLRAFRDYLCHAQIYGADVDRRILFEENRIKTFYVDQTNPESFLDLRNSLPSDLDLIIDDGLHSPNANVATLQFALTKVKVGGWVVIEDIGLNALPVWEVIAALLPPHLEAHLFRANTSLVFAVKKRA